VARYSEREGIPCTNSISAVTGDQERGRHFFVSYIEHKSQKMFPDIASSVPLKEQVEMFTTGKAIRGLYPK
jgi:hypothetical protein